MTNGLSVPPCSSFPTSFATENERLNCLIYASELCMNPSEAADLQMTQAGWHHCSSAARNKAERRNAGENNKRSFFPPPSLGKSKKHDGPENLTPVFVFSLFFFFAFFSAFFFYMPESCYISKYVRSEGATFRSDRKCPVSTQKKWPVAIAPIAVFKKYKENIKGKKTNKQTKQLRELSNVMK